MLKTNLPTIVIAGPTASGKSAAAFNLAKKINGEIICADSRTVYKETSIGTAKPAKNEQAIVRHYGLDLADLGGSFTAHDFQVYASQAIKSIKAARKIPIIAGGTGLYIDGLIYQFSFRPDVNINKRSKLNNLNVSELQAMIRSQKLPMPENNLNKRHLIRVIETKGQQPKKQNLPDDVIYTGLLPSDATLKHNISERVEAMYAGGFIDEVKRLKKMYSSEQIASAGIGYQSALDYLDGKIDLETAKELFKKGDWQLARRQKTWFKRNPDIQWFAKKADLQTHILTCLNK